MDKKKIKFQNLIYSFDFYKRRVGTAIFSLCALLSGALKVIQMIDIYINNYEAAYQCKFTFLITFVSKTLGILFIFFQSFFIFKYANIVIDFGKSTAILGLMRVICINFALFTKTVVAETVSEIRELQHAQHLDNTNTSSRHSAHDNTLTLVKYLGCININVLDVDVSLRIKEAQDKISKYYYFNSSFSIEIYFL